MVGSSPCRPHPPASTQRHAGPEIRTGILILRGAPPHTPARSLCGAPIPRAAPSRARRARRRSAARTDAHNGPFTWLPHTPARSLCGAPVPRGAPSRVRAAVSRPALTTTDGASISIPALLFCSGENRNRVRSRRTVEPIDWSCCAHCSRAYS
jgi:hypothetical protein